MKCLFIDTSTRVLTISISSLDEIFSLVSSNNTNEHSKWALVKMKEAFREAKMMPTDIDRIIVVNGPGSFTGIRIGVTIAKTYAWSLKKDIISISSLLANAMSYDGYDYYISILDARRDHVYAGIYDKEYKSVIDEQYISIDELNNHIDKLQGSKVIVGDIQINNEVKPINLNILKIVNYCSTQPLDNAHQLKPRYLKMVEAEEKKGSMT